MQRALGFVSMILKNISMQDLCLTPIHLSDMADKLKWFGKTKERKIVDICQYFQSRLFETGITYRLLGIRDYLYLEQIEIDTPTSSMDGQASQWCILFTLLVLNLDK